MSGDEQVVTKRSPASAGLAQPCTPANSIVTKGFVADHPRVVTRRDLGLKGAERSGGR